MHLPALTTSQMIEVDRLMIEAYGIDLVQMMENAGRNLAELAVRFAGGSLREREVCVLCGGGNNGGGGMVAGRHLHNRGARVRLVRPAARMKPAPARQWRALEALGLREEPGYDLAQADLILDALIGYGLRADPRPEVAAWIEKANAVPTPVLALDVPSGLDASSGEAGRPTVRAAATLTLALPKAGLQRPESREYTGALYLGDISVPAELYREIGLEVEPLFAQDAILLIRE